MSCPPAGCLTSSWLFTVVPTSPPLSCHDFLLASLHERCESKVSVYTLNARMLGTPPLEISFCPPPPTVHVPSPIFLQISLNPLNGGFSKSEPALSIAWCADPILRHPIGKFRTADRNLAKNRRVVWRARAVRRATISQEGTEKSRGHRVARRVTSGPDLLF